MGEREKSFDDVCMCTDTCALAGASAFFAGIKDAVIVVNGPLWCYFFAMRHIEHSQPTISHRMICTQLDNDAIVFGAEAYARGACPLCGAAARAACHRQQLCGGSDR